MRKKLPGRRTLSGVFFFTSLIFHSPVAAQTVAPANSDTITNLIQHRHGKILLLNVWATWCSPCKEEFPDLIKVHREYSPHDVEVVGISVDYPDEVESKIIPFLQNEKAEFKVYVADFPHQDAFFAHFDARWSGGIPMTFVYDAGGKLRSSHLGKRTFEDFKVAIEDARKK